MVDHPTTLDTYRGMAAQKATELRRLVSEVAADQEALRERQQEISSRLGAAPALTWEDAAEKACHLLLLFAGTLAAEDPRTQTLIANVLDDFRRLSEAPADAPEG